MKVEFLKKFSKDLDNIDSKNIKQSLLAIIDLIDNADSLDHLPNLKKLKGHSSAYRIRIGDYRLGFFVVEETILLARFVHRKDIYKIFP